MPTQDRVLTFDQPVHRRLVHRQSTADVLPTDILVVGPDEFHVGLQWPRHHGLYSVHGIDPLLVAESVRQVTILVCHSGYDVPLKRMFLMTGLRVQVAPGGTQLPIDGLAREVVAEAQGVNVRRSGGGQLLSASVELTFQIGGRVIAWGAGDARVVEAAAYRRARGAHADSIPPLPQDEASDVAPAMVGRLSGSDVLIRRGEGGFRIVVDGSHPFYFDHLLDHVPGIALIEAARQAVSASGLGDVEGISARFDAIVEFSSVAELHLNVEGPTARFHVFQDNRRRAFGEIVLGPGAEPTS